LSSQAVDVYNELKLTSRRSSIITLTRRNPDGGRPPADTGPLLRAGVLLLVTAWENYVEHAVAQAFDGVRTAIERDPTLLSPTLQGFVQDAAKRDVWSVTGGSWLDLAYEQGHKIISELNTPSPGQVERLASNVLGLSKALEHCKWQKKPAARVRSDLGTLVLQVRGEIAHKGTTPGHLNLGGVRDWISFATRLVDKLDVSLAQQVEVRYGVRPW
jgi:hypothetical protein